eukprot:scaffold17526_cov64-Phaeocystis_antarctica.AAC.7
MKPGPANRRDACRECQPRGICSGKIFHPPFTLSTAINALQSAAATPFVVFRWAVVTLRPARRPGDVSERSVPAAAKGDGAPDSEDPALIKKMRNQHTKPGHAMPVREHNGCRAVP